MIRRSAGMTLIELLVAMVILLVLAGLSERTITALSMNQLRVETRRQQLEAVTTLFARIENDISQTVDWGMAGRDGGRPSLWLTDPPNNTLAFIRSGDRQDRRQRIMWQLQGTTLAMSVRLLSDRQPVEWIPVLSGVYRFTWRQMDESGVWRNDWPWPQRLPRAVAVTLELEDGTSFRRMFALDQA